MWEYKLSVKSTTRIHCFSHCTFHNTKEKKCTDKTVNDLKYIHLYICYANVHCASDVDNVKEKNTKHFLTSNRNMELSSECYAKIHKGVQHGSVSANTKGEKH